MRTPSYKVSQELQTMKVVCHFLCGITLFAMTVAAAGWYMFVDLYIKVS